MEFNTNLRIIKSTVGQGGKDFYSPAHQIFLIVLFSLCFSVVCLYCCWNCDDDSYEGGEEGEDFDRYS